MNSLRKYAFRGLAALALLLCVAHFALVNTVERELAQDGMVIRDVSAAEARSPAAPDASEALAVLEPVVPFEEVEPFDDDAQSWSNMTSLFSVGSVVFDANNDGLLDVYFTQDGRNWTRPTDGTGLLLDAPRHQRNMLYLHQGNDADGQPIYKSTHQLMSDEASRQELLVEDFLQPRDAVADPVDHFGRQGQTAVAADFDGNGHVDLWVGNCPPGMPWSHEETQRIVGRFASPAGRQARRSRVPLTPLGMFMVPYEPANDVYNTWSSSRGEEPRGANSLYLNLGDRDGDGVPEWKDVSREAGMEGRACTASISVADIDLDGDLDVYVGNVMDSDLWPGGSKSWAGGVNALWINQLAETGALTFVDRAAEMNVDGVFDDDYPLPEHKRLRRLPYLPAEYSLLSMKYEPFVPEPLAIDEHPADMAEIS